MRRIWITLLAAAIVTAMAVPVGAAPSKCEDAPWLPGCPPNDEDPPTAVKSIDVHIDAEPIWVHEAADTLRYVVTLENTTATDIEGLTIEFTAGSPETKTGVMVPANDTISLDFSQLVSEFTEASPCLDHGAAECGLPATVEVYNGEALVGGDSVSTTLYPEPLCGFTYDENYMSEPVLMEGFGVCIWTLPDDDEGNTKTGIWEITLDPVPPKNPNRPIGVQATVRDGVPGNWCSLAVGTPSAIKERWKAGDDPIVGRVYLPGAENIAGLGLADGMCFNGGAGGEYFAVGNPKSFYLATTEATVTVSWVRALP